MITKRVLNSYTTMNKYTKLKTHQFGVSGLFGNQNLYATDKTAELVERFHVYMGELPSSEKSRI